MRLLYCQQPLSRALGALMRPGKERSCGRPMPGTIDRTGDAQGQSAEQDEHGTLEGPEQPCNREAVSKNH